MTSTLPSLRQMMVRANDGHHKALRRIADGQPLCGPNAFGSEIRGMRTCFVTLRSWECVETERVGMREYVDTITDRGRELLDALDARTAAAVR